MEATTELRPSPARWAASHWFLLLAAALFALPSLFRLGEREWSTEQGAAGPIILASGLWLLVREARALPPMPIARRSVAYIRDVLPLIILLIGYVLARILGILWLEWLVVYVALLWLAFAYVGAAVLAKLWFPLVYLSFLVPPPYAVIGPITQSRKAWLSSTATEILSRSGFDVAYRGTTLYVDQYELLVVDACAGMNSLFSLLAIILFYVYVLHRANWRYALLLALLTTPVVVVANLARVLMLLLTTHYLGIDVAEGVLHDLAGLFMFFVALGILIAADAILAPLRRALSRV